MKKKRILFIVHHRRDRSPGQRFRFEQYLEFLEENGFECVLSPLLNAEEDRIFYSNGNILRKAIIVIKGFVKRLKDYFRGDEFDIIFIFREAFFTGSTFFEKLFKRSKAKLVFDFDDAIWIENVSEANKAFSFLKNASKTGEIISICDMVFAGNSYLKSYAEQFNSHVVIVPTTIDTTVYAPARESSRMGSDKICIGWSGSITTIQHFEYAIPFLKKIKDKYKDQIVIKVIGDGSYINEELQIAGLPWIKSDEIRELSSFDIGIMPLPDDEWAKGKCGLKGLQYMALGIPTIMSPIGVNKDIIQDGENGFLATTEEVWVDKIERLINNQQLRIEMGRKGRETVEAHYSVKACKGIYLSQFSALTKK
jgi:glycosyltransferase involved in cell wall biosynthesis